MGAFLDALQPNPVTDVRPYTKPTFPRMAGFTYVRKPRTMVACEEELISARILIEDRDFCAHYLVDYKMCRYKNTPWFFKCQHEKHDYLNCRHEDQIIRMKEFEREKRLRAREERVRKKCEQKWACEMD